MFRAQICRVVAAAALLASACGPQAGASTVIPATRITLEEALFLPRQDMRYRLPISSWKVCRTSDHAAGARLALLAIVLDEYGILRVGNSNDCNVLVTKNEAIASNASDLSVRGPGCLFLFRRDGEELRGVRMTPQPFSPDQYEKCFFRLGLFIKGFNGALVIPDADLFVPYRNSVWASHPGPPRYVPTFQFLLSGCSVDWNSIQRRSEVPADLGCKYEVSN